MLRARHGKITMRIVKPNQRNISFHYTVSSTKNHISDRRPRSENFKALGRAQERFDKRREHHSGLLIVAITLAKDASEKDGVRRRGKDL